MKKIPDFLYIILIMTTILISGCKKDIQAIHDRDRLFDSEWRFRHDSIQGAEEPSFDDSGWRVLDLPHDWSIEDLPGPARDGQIGPFSKGTPGQFLTGHTTGGEGWYRKHFILAPGDTGKNISLLFEGICNESDVWLNGHHLGYHPNSYTSFSYNINTFLNAPGQMNVLAVRVRNIGQTSRWYSGSGIYRHVWLTVTDPVHIANWGIFATTPEVSKEKAKIKLLVSVENSSISNEEFQLVAELFTPDGKPLSTVEQKSHITAKGKADINLEVDVKNPQLWSPGTPVMYKSEISILKGNKILDRKNIKVGIRTITYNAEKGLQINGETIKLRGGCLHHDNGILGAAAIDRAEERRVEIMKMNGFNAIRCSHNPPSPKFLDACDSLGILVMDEVFDTWTHPKTPRDYNLYFANWWRQDLESMVKRDRNHPSVIIWSLGNEIQERADVEGLAITRQITDEIHKYDSSRPTSEAMCAFLPFLGGAHPWSYSAAAFALLDIGGYNYTWREWDNDHKLYPKRVMMTTESMPIDMFDIWTKVENSPWVIGDFVWSGMDYLGESGIASFNYENEKVSYGMSFPGMGDMGFGRGWPWFVSWCGDIDILGFKKPQSYYRDVVWNRSQMEIAVQPPDSLGRKQLISLWGWPEEIPCWTWPGKEGQKTIVNVYTKCTSVRLELNGKVIGEKDVTAVAGQDNSTGNLISMKPFEANTQLTARFEIPYVAGELKAIGLIKGSEVITKTLKTLGKPAKIILAPDRSSIHASRNDLAYVTVEVADKEGNVIPNATASIHFTLKGDGEIAAVGNGSPNQMRSFKQPEVKLYHGKAMVILRPFTNTGKISLKAESDSLEPASIEVDTY